MKTFPRLVPFTLTADTPCQLWHGTAHRLDTMGTLPAGGPVEVELPNARDEAALRRNLGREWLGEYLMLRTADGYRYQVKRADLERQGFQPTPARPDAGDFDDAVAAHYAHYSAAWPR